MHTEFCLIHFLIIELFSKIIYHFYLHLLFYQIIFTIIIIIIGLGLSLTVMSIVKNSPIRNMYKYLFG